LYEFFLRKKISNYFLIYIFNIFAYTICHSSLVNGILLSKTARYIYQHNDKGFPEKLLQSHQNRYRGTLIITDGVFIIEETIAKIKDLVLLAQAYHYRFSWMMPMKLELLIKEKVRHGNTK